MALTTIVFQCVYYHHVYYCCSPHICTISCGVHAIGDFKLGSKIQIQSM
uniref:Uncharacterized protein n=1 Tax=Anguilla anguilla TaxID=7936 RepID=A0A0E9S9F3_ANGAN